MIGKILCEIPMVVLSKVKKIVGLIVTNELHKNGMGGFIKVELPEQSSLLAV